MAGTSSPRPINLDAGISLRPDVFLDRRPGAVFFVLSAIYLAFALLLVHIRILSEDEFYTLYESKIGTAGAMWEFLRTSSEGQTPAFMLLMQTLAHTLGDSVAVLRSPAVLGYWLMIAAVYWILAPRFGALWAACGALLAMAARYAPFAAEARCYALVLGASSAALYCWLWARRTARPLAYVSLAVSVLCSASTHYYSLFAVLPLALAQAVSDFRERKIAWPIWLAFCMAPMPNVAALPIIRDSHALQHFWSAPTISQLADSTMNVLGPELGSVLAVLLVAALLAARHAEAHSGNSNGFAPEEYAALWGLVGLPLAGWLFSVFVTHAYVERYVPQPVIGISIVFAAAIARGLRGSRQARLICAAAMLFLCLALDTIRLRNARAERSALEDGAAFLNSYAPGSLPVVVSSAEVWFRLDYYFGSTERIPSFLYLCDPALTLRYENQNMVETHLSGHREVFPRSLQMFRSFTDRRQPFLLLAADSFRPGWLPVGLAAEKWTLTLLGRGPLGVLYRAEPPG